MKQLSDLFKSTSALFIFLGAIVCGHARSTVYDFTSGWDNYNPLGLGTYTLTGGDLRIQSSAPTTQTIDPLEPEARSPA